MRPIELPFEIPYKGETIKVTEQQLSSKRVFYIQLNRPLIITVGIKHNDEKFWTSIPEGRQREAEEIGPLIAQYIRTKK
jgi:hypothetical protein